MVYPGKISLRPRGNALDEFFDSLVPIRGEQKIIPFRPGFRKHK